MNRCIYIYLLTAGQVLCEDSAWKLVNMMSIDWNYICDPLNFLQHYMYYDSLKKLLFIMIIINLVQRFEFAKLYDSICNKVNIIYYTCNYACVI